MVRSWSQTSGASFWPISNEDIDQLRWFNNNFIGQIQSRVDSHGSFYNRNSLSIGFIGNGLFTTAITELIINWNSINLANSLRKGHQLLIFTRDRVRIYHGDFIEYNYSSSKVDVALWTPEAMECLSGVIAHMYLVWLSDLPYDSLGLISLWPVNHDLVKNFESLKSVSKTLVSHIGILNLRAKHGTPNNKASGVPRQPTAGVDILNETAMTYS